MRANVLAGIWVCIVGLAMIAEAQVPRATRDTRVRPVDLDVGQAQEVELADGSKAFVKLLSLQEDLDPLRSAVRVARVRVEVNGEAIELISGTYRLPIAVAGVQIDCPITRGYTQRNRQNVWGLLRDARLRLWPANVPLMEPGTFVYPLKQRWFASATQMSNEPTYVDGGERPGTEFIYYHNDLDFGGAEGMVEVVAATNALVVSSGTDCLAGYEETPVRPRYDVVYLLDERGWFYRYSHLHTIDSTIRPGKQVRPGQKIGMLGKEGASGGWSHLHFGIVNRQPSGQWGTEDAYAFVWEAYRQEYKPTIVAVARPHHFAPVGQKVVLDGSRSWSSTGKIDRYEWTFTDGSTATGPVVERAYEKPGTYSEIIKVTDRAGEVAYDFAIVQVVDRAQADRLPPTIHAAYAPTMDIQPGDPVTFKVRSFRTTTGSETWDFGDGTPPLMVKSDGNAKPLAKDGYAAVEHRFQKPGNYIVRVERANEQGHRAIAHLHVLVGKSQGAESITTQFKEVDTLFANPHKGWLTHQRLPNREPRLPCSVAYFRLNWGDIEPTEGQYDWKLIDEAIEAWGKRDARVAFRIMTTNAHTRGYYCSPKWLFEAGCRFHEYERGGDDPTAGGVLIKRIEPDYADPLFLSKHGAFIQALGERYDGHPRVEFLDMGSYGIWGEWHTSNGKPWEVRQGIIDMYLSVFRKTPLVSMSDDAQALAYAIERGAGFRRDGVGSPWHEANWMGSKKYEQVKGFAEQWKHAPVVFEWYGSYEYLLGRKWPFDRAVQFILANHATYINDNLGAVPPEQWPKVEQLARLVGYRFVLRQVAHAATVRPGQELKVAMKWSNVGVGRLYRRYPLALYLLDADGRAVCRQVQGDTDPAHWLPGNHDVAAIVKVPANLPPGRYVIATALLDPQTEKPAIHLAMDAAQEGRMYRIGQVDVR